MNNNLERIKNKISNNELILGTVVSFNDPEVSEVLCSCGFDFIWIDGEHGALDKKMIDLHILAVRGSGAAPFVRIPWNDPVLVKPILDMGPAGIIFPFIRNAEEAKLAVSSCRYPPKGIRGFGPRRANCFSKMEMDDYLKISEKEPWVMLQIEHIEGVNNLKEIVNVEGVGGIVVGPNDLSGSIGLLGQTKHPEVIKLTDKIADICKNTNTIFGLFTGYGDVEGIKDWIKKGATWLALDWDVGHLISSGRRAYDSAINIFKEMQK